LSGVVWVRRSLPLVRGCAGGAQLRRAEDPDQRPWRCRLGVPQGEVVVEMGVLLLDEQQPPCRHWVDVAGLG
jgi:hypothetical protein